MGTLQKGVVPRGLDKFRSSSHALFELGIKQRLKPDMLAPFDSYPLDENMMAQLKAVCPAETPQAHLDVFLRSRDDWQKINLQRALGRVANFEAELSQRRPGVSEPLQPIQPGLGSSVMPGYVGGYGPPPTGADASAPTPPGAPPGLPLAAETTAVRTGLRGLSFPALKKHFEKSRWRSTQRATFTEDAVRSRKTEGLEVPIMAKTQPSTFRVHLRSVDNGPKTLPGPSFFGRHLSLKKRREGPEVQELQKPIEGPLDATMDLEDSAPKTLAQAQHALPPAASSVRPELRGSLDRWKEEDPDTFNLWNDSARSLNWVAHQYSGPRTTYSEYGRWGESSPAKQRKFRPIDTLGSHAASSPRKLTEREKWETELKQDPEKLQEMRDRIPNCPKWTGPAEDGIEYQLTLKPNKTREPFSNSQVTVKAALVHGMTPRIQTHNQDVHSDRVQQPSRRIACNPGLKVSGCAFIKGNRRHQFPCVAIAVTDAASTEVVWDQQPLGKGIF